jgi:hypothetical protein
VRHDMSGIVLHVEYDFADDMRATVCALLNQLFLYGAKLLNSKTRFTRIRGLWTSHHFPLPVADWGISPRREAGDGSVRPLRLCPG